MERHVAFAGSAFCMFLPAGLFFFFLLLLISAPGWASQNLKILNLKYSPLITLPVLWLITPMIGGFFARDHSTPIGPRPVWVGAFAWTPLIAFLLLSFYFSVRFSDARLAVFTFAAVNFLVLLVATAFALVCITGDFI